MAAEPGASPEEAAVIADVSALLVPWSGEAFCTGPRDQPLDLGLLVTREGNRWSGNDEPTVYLAGDPGVAIAELGRHWGERDGAAAVWSLRVDLAAVIDLREAAAQRSLGLPDDPSWILDVEGCRAMAAVLRERGDCDGIIVPSAAVVDDPSRWNAVIFVERLRTGIETAIQVEAMLLEVSQTGR
jgi:RES domain-containing protein